MTAYLVPDIYELNFSGPPPFEALVADPSVAGVILKCTQGVQYAPNWFIQNWPRARAVAGGRYGSSWFRGTYHFGMPTASGDVQADFCLNHIARAGGLGAGDMPIAWDLEGNAWSSNQQIVDISSQFAARIKERTGKTPVLYTGATVRDRGITDKMGFSKIWTPHLDMSKAGWSLSDYCLWQYKGGGTTFYNPALQALYNFPTSIPGWGSTLDMSVVMSGGGPASSLFAVQSSLTGGIPAAFLMLGAAALAFYLLWER